MNRLWEVDFSRGVAIILMIVFNWSYALRYIGIYSVGGGWIYWTIFPRVIGFLFIFIMSMSLVLSYNSDKDRYQKRFFKRGMFIFSLGMLITLVTWLFFPDEFVRFGVLHLIGLSTIFAIPFMRFKKLNLILGSAIVLIGTLVQNFTFDFSWLLWLGLTPNNFVTFDYFPLLPWFGVVLLGIFFGNILYKNNKRNYKIPDFSKLIPVKFVSFLGRNSLMIYLLHQPILLLILFMSGYSLF